jgi:hypothetical protein
VPLPSPRFIQINKRKKKLENQKTKKGKSDSTPHKLIHHSSINRLQNAPPFSTMSSTGSLEIVAIRLMSFAVERD